MLRTDLFKSSSLYFLALCVAALTATAGCDGDTSNNPDDDAVDGDTEDGTDDSTDEACVLHDECQSSELCIDGDCIAAPTCAGISKADDCVDPLEEIQDDLGRFASCLDGYCRPSCASDAECVEGRICSDFGRCIPFTGTLAAGPGGEAKKPLEAGYGEALLNYPIGVPLGGYGSRQGGTSGKYTSSLSASVGTFNGQYARAVALDNGESELMLIRVPLIFTTFSMHERVARRLQEETGEDWRDALVISSTHTHSGPARFWRLPTVSVLPLGILGAGDFAQPVEDWLVESITDAALAALADRESASLAWEIVEGFDQDDTVARDRWSQTPPFDDNRLLLIRVDGPDDKPKAVIFSYGAHGTDNSSDYATDDMLGGAETGLSDALSQEYGQFVPAIFFAQNSGSMSPASGSQGHRFPHSRERAGFVMVEKAFEKIVAMSTSSDVEFASKAYRFPITYDLVGYERDEYGTTNTIAGGEFSSGAIQCNGKGWDEEGYDVFVTPEDLSCFSLSFILYGQQPTPLAKSQMTAISLDGLSILTAPGELTMDLGWEMTRVLVEETGMDPHTFWTFPYANDHLLYLTPTRVRGGLPPYLGFRVEKAPEDYPDYAFSFLQGGYEPSLTPWGWKFGDYVVARAVDAWRYFEDENATLGVSPVLPAEYSRDDSIAFELTADDASEPMITAEPPTSVERLETIEMSWIGGVAGAEAPQTPLVTLVRVDGDNETDVIHENFRAYTNRESVMATRVRGAVGGLDEWVVRWEPVKSFELGTYRFRLDGHNISASGERVPYVLESATFEVTAFDDIAVNATVNDDVVSGTISYGVPAPFTFAEDTPGDRGALTGALRMRNGLVPDALADPPIADEDIRATGIAVTLTSDSSAVTVSALVETEYVAAGGKTGVPVTNYSFTIPETGAFSLTVTDEYGNSGSTSFSR